MASGSELESPSQGAASVRYRYAAFIMLFFVLIGGFLLKLYPSVFLQIKVPEDSARSLPGLTSTERFVMTGRIDINTSDKEGLMLLPGIGRGLAMRIIEHREELGGFRSIDELRGVEGIGKHRLEAIKAFPGLKPRSIIMKHGSSYGLY